MRALKWLFGGKTKQGHGRVFSYLFLGYTATSDEALKIIQETGVFYLIISLAYLFSYLFLYQQSQAIRDKWLHHFISISVWGGLGIALINNIAPLFISIITNFFAAMALLALLRVAPILTKISFSLPPLNLKLKSHEHFGKLLENKKYLLIFFIHAHL